jgi:serine/threonine protein kinase
LGDHPIAVKSLKKSSVIQLKQVDHIKNEKNILAEIDNPFIVNMYVKFEY